MAKIAVLIPCYNESQTIAKVVRDYRQALPEATIYVYDNNSVDGTDEIARAAGAVVRYEYRQGKGNVIRTMFRDIDADCYLMIDGDRLSSTYFTENKRPFHNVGNVMVRKFINMFWRPKNPILDVMTGYRAFSPLFVKSFPVLSKGFEIETEMTIHALDKNFLLRSLPVNYQHLRRRRESHHDDFQSVSRLQTAAVLRSGRADFCTPCADTFPARLPAISGDVTCAAFPYVNRQRLFDVGVAVVVRLRINFGHDCQE